MPLSEVVGVAAVTHLAEAGGLVTLPTQVHLGLTRVQTPLVAGTAEALMVEVHPMIGNVRVKIKEMSRFRYEK